MSTPTLVIMQCILPAEEAATLIELIRNELRNRGVDAADCCFDIYVWEVASDD